MMGRTAEATTFDQLAWERINALRRLVDDRLRNSIVEHLQHEIIGAVVTDLSSALLTDPFPILWHLSQDDSGRGLSHLLAYVLVYHYDGFGNHANTRVDADGVEIVERIWMHAVEDAARYQAVADLTDEDLARTFVHLAASTVVAQSTAEDFFGEKYERAGSIASWSLTLAAGLAGGLGLGAAGASGAKQWAEAIRDATVVEGIEDATNGRTDGRSGLGVATLFAGVGSTAGRTSSATTEILGGFVDSAIEAGKREQSEILERLMSVEPDIDRISAGALGRIAWDTICEVGMGPIARADAPKGNFLLEAPAFDGEPQRVRFQHSDEQDEGPVEEPPDEVFLEFDPEIIEASRAPTGNSADHGPEQPSTRSAADAKPLDQLFAGTERIPPHDSTSLEDRIDEWLETRDGPDLGPTEAERRIGELTDDGDRDGWDVAEDLLVAPEDLEEEVDPG